MISIVDENDLHFTDEFTALYFYSLWMPENKHMNNMISKMESTYNIKFIAINVDNYKNTCVRFNIKNIPTILIFNFNKEIDRIIGVPLTSGFKKRVSDIVTKRKLENGD